MGSKPRRCVYGVPTMTEQEKQWFNALTKDRSDNARTLEKPAMRGIQRSVVEKYSDQAHFICELLQNADDVKATSARFRLEKGGLFFIHNGSVRFSVSNPQSEDADTSSSALGHINSITSIANSNKAEVSIGKKLSEKPLSYESLYLNGACVLFGAMRLSRSWIPRIRIMHSLESVRRS